MLEIWCVSRSPRNSRQKSRNSLRMLRLSITGRTPPSGASGCEHALNWISSPDPIGNSFVVESGKASLSRNRQSLPVERQVAFAESRRLFQRAIHPKTDTLMERLRVDPQFPRPGYDWHRFPVKGHQPIVPRVQALLCLCRPSNVSRLVSTIVVDAFNRVLGGWFSPNVPEECLERVSPLFTDKNPTTAVVSICMVLLIVASGTHVLPASILRRVAHAMGRVWAEFWLEATARIDITIPEGVEPYV